jgi:hypothetical protein
MWIRVVGALTVAVLTLSLGATRGEALPQTSCANVSSVNLGLGNGIMQSVAPQVIASVPQGCRGSIAASFSVWRGSHRLAVRVQPIRFRRVPVWKHAVMAEWQWVNWCGGDTRVTVKATIGRASASIPNVEAPPCNAAKYGSGAAPLFACPAPPYAVLPKRPAPWCPPGFQP